MYIIKLNWFCQNFVIYIFYTIYLTKRHTVLCHRVILFMFTNRNTILTVKSNNHVVYSLKIFIYNFQLFIQFVFTYNSARDDCDEVTLFDYKRNIDRNMFVNYTFLLISFTDISVDRLIFNVVWFRFLFYHCIYVTSVLRVLGCGFRCLYLFLCIIGGDVQYVLDYIRCVV